MREEESSGVWHLGSQLKKACQETWSDGLAKAANGEGRGGLTAVPLGGVEMPGDQVVAEVWEMAKACGNDFQIYL